MKRNNHLLRKRTVLFVLCTSCLFCTNAHAGAEGRFFYGPLTGTETVSGTVDTPPPPPAVENNDTRTYAGFMNGDRIIGRDTGKGYYAVVDAAGSTFNKNMEFKGDLFFLDNVLFSSDASSQPGMDAYGFRWNVSNKELTLAPLAEVEAIAGTGNAYAFSQETGGRTDIDITATARTDIGNAYGLHNRNQSVIDVPESLVNNIMAEVINQGNAYAVYNEYATVWMGDDTLLDAKTKDGDAFGVYNVKESTFSLGNGNLTTSIFAEVYSQGNAYGLYNTGNSVATIGDGVLFNISSEGNAYGLYNTGNSVATIGDDVLFKISSEGNAYAIYGDHNSQTIVGNEAYVEINSFFSNDDLYGVWLNDNSSATFGKKASFTGLNMNMMGDGDIYGIRLDNQSTLKLGDESSIDVSVALGSGNIYALYVRNSSTVTIDGTLQFAAPIDFSNHSILTGTLRGWDTLLDEDAGSLLLSDHSVWNNTGDSQFLTLSLQDSLIRQEANATLTVAGTYQGSGTIAFSSIENNSVALGSVLPQSGGTNSFLALTACDANVDTTTSASALKQLNNLAHQLRIDDASAYPELDATAHLASTPLTPQADGILSFEQDNTAYYGKIDLSDMTVGDRATDSMRAIRAAQDTAYFASRVFGDDLNRRFAELHGMKAADSGELPWFRTYGGRMKRGGADYTRTDYYAVQIGYDRPVRKDATGTWYFGYAADYLRLDDDYRSGNGKNTAGALSLYASRTGNGGNYLDLALRAARINSDYSVYADGERSSGDYHNWLFGLSAEYGRRIDAGKNWFVEPQVQLAFAAIDGADYTTENGIRVAQDNRTSVIGRLGLRAGRTLTNGGMLYLRASLLHEFDGEGGASLSRGAIRTTYEQDLGDTWYEFGLGGAFPLAAHSQGYFELTKTTGGNFDTSLQWNAGCRWTF